MFTLLRKLFRSWTRRNLSRRVVLRDERRPSGTRYLSAAYSPQGDLVIEGQDLGDEVEHAFGRREYEWVWTIRKANLATLSAALSGNDDVLDGLASRFSGRGAAKLHSFLSESGVPFETWSRMGD